VRRARGCSAATATAHADRPTDPPAKAVAVAARVALPSRSGALRLSLPSGCGRRGHARRPRRRAQCGVASQARGRGVRYNVQHSHPLRAPTDLQGRALEVVVVRQVEALLPDCAQRSRETKALPQRHVGARGHAQAGACADRSPPPCRAATADVLRCCALRGNRVQTAWESPTAGRREVLGVLHGTGAVGGWKQSLRSPD
jgi:hypothetical protein